MLESERSRAEIDSTVLVGEQETHGTFFHFFPTNRRKENVICTKPLCIDLGEASVEFFSPFGFAIADHGHIIVVICVAYVLSNKHRTSSFNLYYVSHSGLCHKFNFKVFNTEK